MINILDMKKIISNIENVVIGSGSLEENKFQVLNFMNMLYDNINEPENDKCMTIDVVISNLEYEIGKLLKVKKVTITIMTDVYLGVFLLYITMLSAGIKIIQKL